MLKRSAFVFPNVFDNWRDDVKAAILEYVGTTFFLLLAFGGIQAAKAEMAASLTMPSTIVHDLYIALSLGFSLLVSVWVFYRASGGVFNPNVSLALFLTGVIGPLRFVLYCIAQLFGGITAAAIMLALTPGPLLSNTFLADGVNVTQGIFIEMFITSALVFSVLMLAAEKHPATPFAPVGIGLTSFVGHLWGVYYTCAGMNVARAFGPAVVTGFPYSSQWVYWVGDGLGSLLAATLYTLMKQNEYWLLNPGQDMVCVVPSSGGSFKEITTSCRPAELHPTMTQQYAHREQDGGDPSTTVPIDRGIGSAADLRGRRRVTGLV